MEENRTGIDRELQMKDRVQLGRSKSRHGIQGTSKRSGTVEKIRKRSSSRAGASAVQEQKVLQKSHTSKSGHPPKHGAVRVPPKTAKAVPAREEKYIGNVGAFSRLHQPVVPAQNTESPYLRSETTKGTLGSKKSAQSSHTMPRLVEKGQTTRPAQRKGASRTVFGGEQLIEATPYGVQGFRASTANGSFKDSRPVVVPRVDRSVQEIDELYNRCQFYDLVSFFGISNSDDPFAQVDNDEDNFTIDVIDNLLSLKNLTWAQVDLKRKAMQQLLSKLFRVNLLSSPKLKLRKIRKLG